MALRDTLTHGGTTLCPHCSKPLTLFRVCSGITLTLFEARQGQFDPQHHTYVCSFYSNRARLTKIGDFVSLTIWLVPKKPFLKFLLQNFWKIWILNFWGSSSISRKLKILTKKIIFLQRFSFFLAESILYMFSAFFWDI